MAKDSLGRLIDDARRYNAISNQLIRCVEGICKRELFDVGSDAEDISQCVLIRFIRTWQRIDTRKNPYAFIRRMIQTERFRFRRAGRNRQKRIVYEYECGEQTIEKQQAREIRSVRCGRNVH